MVTGEIVVGSKVITTDDNGVVTNVKHIENGWSCHNGVWYYYMNGEPYTGVVGKYWVVDGKIEGVYCLSQIHGLEMVLTIQKKMEKWRGLNG